MLAAFSSLAALLVAIAISLGSRVNPGIIAVLFSYLLGVFVLHQKIRDISAGYPAHLLLTLLGLTLLFGHARANGTLDRIAGWAVGLSGGRVGFLPLIFFALAAMLGTLGAGNIGAVALLAPIAMAVAGELSISPFLMALMVACGGNASAFSPVAPTGVIALSLMARIGLTPSPWLIYGQCLLAHVVVAGGGFLAFGGLGLILADRKKPSTGEGAAGTLENSARAGRIAALLAARRQPFERKHIATLFILGSLLILVSGFGLDIGVLSFAAAILLAALRLGDEEAALATIPWGTIIMVTGMTLLVSILEKTGGIELFSRLLLRFSTPRSAPLVVGLVTGALSAYSSSSGVVLPAFLPTIPGLVEKLGGGRELALALAYSVNIGAHLVDVSPLSTLGALCLSNAAAGCDCNKLYRQLLGWGVLMIFVGGLYCGVVFGILKLGCR